MVVLQGVILAVLFLVELAALAGFGYWGFQVGPNAAFGWLLGIGTPLAAAVFWGLFVAPKANFPVSIPVRTLLQALVFALSGWSLHAAGKSNLALIFLIVAFVDLVLVRTMKL